MSQKSPPRDDNFIQEYLYIEEHYEAPQETKPEKKEEEVERGVIIIDLF